MAQFNSALAYDIVTGPAGFQAFEQLGALYSPYPPNGVVSAPTGYIDSSAVQVKWADAAGTTVVKPNGATVVLGVGGGAGAFTTLTASAAVTLSPAAANVVLSPTGAGLVTINPATAGAMDNVNVGATTAQPVRSTTLTATGAVTLSPANVAVAISPSGTGTVAISPVGALTVNPTAASTINNTSIGVTTPAVVKTSNLQAGVFTDISGTPGAGTSSGTRGRAAFAAAASTIVVTSTLVTATSSVFIQLEGAADATLTSVLGVTLAAGSFTVTGNAAATAAKTFSFLVVN